MKYGKIENGAFQYAPNPLWIGEGAGRAMVANPTAEMYEEHGWLPIEETPVPEYEEGYYWTPSYAEEDGEIRQAWERMELNAGDKQ